MFMRARNFVSTEEPHGRPKRPGENAKIEEP